ncbi:PH domain-containing protein [Nocardioides sp. zg-1228]|uniref:PH domain-containing protein n=1 Tax=Nocardioides sp. zg-1228 TaxID=2763008 RepID=UPI00164278D7|nr:PH domain-containing protein [Nocardioides sp. zg-1228]MBC2935092.1 PH domain-containing protein [Nocardioides sp. zg-1228]QSF56076.1 PH domain-containing protein [Nocardioides sp. zg-1228]
MPAASEGPEGRPPVPDADLPRTWRPMGVRLAVVGFGLVLLVVCAAAWIGFGDETRAKFNILQRLTLLAMGAGFGVIGWALGRARVTAERAGLVVVNGFRTRRLAWEQVVAVHLRSGAPWATLDLADGTSVSAMAFQGSDGKAARDGVRELRALIDRAGSEGS